MSKLQELIQELCPDGVEYKKLENIGAFFGGLTGKSKDDFKDGNAKFITYRNVYANPSLNIDIKDKVKISENEKQHIVKYGDILFTGSSETPDECGMSSVVTTQTSEKLYLNSFCFGLRLYKIEEFNLYYLKHILRSNDIREQIKKTASGVTRYNVSKKRFAQICIPVPPIEIQTEIALILDNFMSLAAELQARQEQYEYYRNKLLTFEKDAEGMEWKRLPDICENLDRRRKPVTASNRTFGPYPYYGASGIVDYVSSYIFDGNYLLISEDGANLLARSTPIAFSISGKNWVNNHAHVLKFQNMFTQKYIEYYINMIDVSQYVSGGAQPKLNQENLNKILIPIPPLSEQQRIVSILDKFETLVNDLSQGLPAEIAAVQEQYEYYRNKLLSFPINSISQK